MKQEGNSPHSESPEPLERRNLWMKFRVTKAEREAINQRAAGREARPSEHMRSAALGTRAKKNTQATGERLRLIEALAEQGKIGSNLNQIARACNSGYEPERAAIQNALALLERVQGVILEELQR